MTRELRREVGRRGRAMRRCVMCKQEKPLEDFAFRSKATGKRQDHCRACHKAYRREHYLRNRDTYIRREVARIARYRDENRIKLFAYLSEHPCVDCGETDVTVLDFDHRDPSTKKREVTVIALQKPWKFVAAEIEKCDVRCANCHRRRTGIQLGWTVHVVSAHDERGTPKRSDDVQVGSDLMAGASGPLRRCSKCKRDLPLAQFGVKEKKTERLRTWCRECCRTYGREHYSRNKGDYLARKKRNERHRVNNRRHRDRRRALARSVMEGRSCIDCGESDPRVLEFDHRDGEIKEAEVSRLIASRRWDMVDREIAKCDVRCANCHRKRTARQFNWTKFSLQQARTAKKEQITGEERVRIEPIAGVA